MSARLKLKKLKRKMEFICNSTIDTSKETEIADKVYVVIEFDRETDEFSEIEGVFLSQEKAEDFANDCNARYFRYSYRIYEETLNR